MAAALEKTTAGCKPDFIIIGAQKSGSTWLQEMLHQHPEIYVPDIKEVNYFVRAEHNRHSRHELGWEWYQELYAPHVDKVTGDVTPDYIYWDYCAADIARALPNVKIVAILRHPVERAYSQYWMSRRSMIRERSFEEMLETNEHLIGRSRYASQLEPYIQAVPRSQMKIFFYEDFFASPGKNLKELFSFLDVDPDFQPWGVNQRVGGTVEYKGFAGWIIYKVISPIITNPLILPVYRLARYHTNFRDIFVRIFSRRKGYPPMHPETRMRLLTLFEADNRRLEDLLGCSVPVSWNY